LIGRVRSDCICELRQRIQTQASPTVLDLAEVALVDLQSVRFLRECQDRNIELRNCPSYILEWIRRERAAVKDFGHAAKVARDAGFDGVQIQGGFVYLFQQFLHDVTNRRIVRYGGPVENRARFLFEALEAVLEVWPSNRVGVKAGPMMNERGAFRATDETLKRASMYTGNFPVTTYRICSSCARWQTSPVRRLSI